MPQRLGMDLGGSKGEVLQAIRMQRQRKNLLGCNKGSFWRWDDVFALPNSTRKCGRKEGLSLFGQLATGGLLQGNAIAGIVFTTMAKTIFEMLRICRMPFPVD